MAADLGDRLDVSARRRIRSTRRTRNAAISPKRTPVYARNRMRSW
jgi:hypothetical protein